MDLKNIWLEKIAAEDVSPLSQAIKTAAATPQMRPTASAIKSNIAPMMVVSFNEADQASKLFIERLDKVLQSQSGLDRMKIVALNANKDQNTMKELKVSGSSISLYKGGKHVGTLAGNSTEQQIATFLNENKKNLI